MAAILSELSAPRNRLPTLHHQTHAQSLAALKADTRSILAFEVDLFGRMALTYFVFFPSPPLMPTSATYWFVMQLGMIIGYFTSYPMNHFLVRWGPQGSNED